MAEIENRPSNFIRTRIDEEVQRIIQELVRRVKMISERYASTLSELEKEVEENTSKVEKAMLIYCSTSIPPLMQRMHCPMRISRITATLASIAREIGESTPQFGSTIKKANCCDFFLIFVT